MTTNDTTAPEDISDAPDVDPSEQPKDGEQAAEKDEPKDDPNIASIDFRGVRFTFPANRADWPTRAMQAFQKRQNADGVELLFGPAQWLVFNEMFPKLADFWEFFPQFAAAAGFMSAGD